MIRLWQSVQAEVKLSDIPAGLKNINIVYQWQFINVRPISQVTGDVAIAEVRKDKARYVRSVKLVADAP
jgi:hypothetical protein